MGGDHHRRAIVDPGCFQDFQLGGVSDHVPRRIAIPYMLAFHDPVLDFLFGQGRGRPATDSPGTNDQHRSRGRLVDTKQRIELFELLPRAGQDEDAVIVDDRVRSCGLKSSPLPDSDDIDIRVRSKIDIPQAAADQGCSHHGRLRDLQFVEPTDFVAFGIPSKNPPGKGSSQTLPHLQDPSRPGHFQNVDRGNAGCRRDHGHGITHFPNGEGDIRIPRIAECRGDERRLIGPCQSISFLIVQRPEHHAVASIVQRQGLRQILHQHHVLNP